MSPKDVIIPPYALTELNEKLLHIRTELVPIASMPCVDFANYAACVSLGLSPLYTKLNTMTYVARVRIVNVGHFVTKAAAKASTEEEERKIIAAHVGRAAADVLANLFGNEVISTGMLTALERKEAQQADTADVITVAVGVNVDLTSVRELGKAAGAPDTPLASWEVMATVELPVAEEVWAAAMEAVNMQVMRTMTLNMEAAQNLTAAEATATMLLSRVADAAAGDTPAPDAPDSNPTH